MPREVLCRLPNATQIGTEMHLFLTAGGGIHFTDEQLRLRELRLLPAVMQQGEAWLCWTTGDLCPS